MPAEHAWTIVVKLDYDDANIPIIPSNEESLKTCLGYAKSQRRRCRNPISWAMYDGINAIIRDLVDGACQSTSKLAELAERLLCKHSHRNQASNLEKALSKAFDHFTRKSPPTPISPISVIVPFPDTPLPPLVSSIRYSSPASRSVAPTTLQKTLKTHFEPHHPTTKNAEQIGELVKKRADEEVGYIYMFRYRDSDPNGPIKIGNSKNITNRMDQIRKTCKVDPVIISDPNQRPIKYACKAERLVFLVLYNQRREIRRCPGCRTTHIEWFEIDEASAMQVIEKVRQFMEDRYGSVSPEPVLEGRADLGQPHLLELECMAKQLEELGRIPEPVTEGRTDLGQSHVFELGRMARPLSDTTATPNRAVPSRSDKLEVIPFDLPESHKAPRTSGERHRDHVPSDKPSSCFSESSNSQEAHCSGKTLQGQQDKVSSRHTCHKNLASLQSQSDEASSCSGESSDLQGSRCTGTSQRKLEMVPLEAYNRVRRRNTASLQAQSDEPSGCSGESSVSQEPRRVGMPRGKRDIKAP